MRAMTKITARVLLIAVGLAMVALTPLTASADVPGQYTCSSGSVQSGTYTTLTVTGACALNAGPVTVTAIATITGSGSLVGRDSTSRFFDQGDLDAGPNTIVELGCDPSNFACTGNSRATLRDEVDGNLNASGAEAVILYDTSVVGNVIENGGGASCATHLPATLGGGSVYSLYDRAAISGSLSVTGVATCGLGAVSNLVSGNVTYNNNAATGTPSNQIAANLISGNLACQGNTPAPGLHGKSGNLVSGSRTGQCANLGFSFFSFF